MLDLNASSTGHVLGYNNRDLINNRDNALYDKFVKNNTDITTVPANDLADMIRANVMPAAPNGMLSMHLGEGETAEESNALAISAAFQHYAKQHGANADNLAVISFENMSHSTEL